MISNLLRHLFKSILEVRNYDELVEKIIARYKLPITVDAFNIWLYSHRINYKRYLRLSTVRFLFRSSKDPEMSLILRVLLTEFVRNYCISHFLTSKRMGKNSSKMHMTGARNLLEEMLE